MQPIWKFGEDIEHLRSWMKDYHMYLTLNTFLCCILRSVIVPHDKVTITDKTLIEKYKAGCDKTQIGLPDRYKEVLELYFTQLKEFNNNNLEATIFPGKVLFIFI